VVGFGVLWNMVIMLLIDIARRSQNVHPAVRLRETLTINKRVVDAK
jgi:hypothetical protein